MKKLLLLSAFFIASAFAAEPQVGTKAVVASPGSKAAGDLLYWDGSAYARQAIGSAGQLLIVGTNRTYFSGVATIVSTNLNVIGAILGHSLTLTNGITIAASLSTSGTNATLVGNLLANGLTATNGLTVAKTITTPATTGDQEINKPAGRVNIAAEGTTITVTNSLCTANSIVLCSVATADDTAVIKSVVAGSGSFVITLTAAATAETAINFLVVN